MAPQCCRFKRRRAARSRGALRRARAGSVAGARARRRRSVRSWRRARCGSEEASTSDLGGALTAAALPGPRRRGPLPPLSPAFRLFLPLPPCLRASPSAPGRWALRPREAEAFPSEPPHPGNAASLTPVWVSPARRPPSPDSCGLARRISRPCPSLRIVSDGLARARAAAAGRARAARRRMCV